MYDSYIHERLVGLGVDDFVWEEGESTFRRLFKVPNQKVESHCTVECAVRDKGGSNFSPDSGLSSCNGGT